MSGRERCDEIIRIIDRVLAEVGQDIAPAPVLRPAPVVAEERRSARSARLP